MSAIFQFQLLEVNGATLAAVSKDRCLIDLDQTIISLLVCGIKKKNNSYFQS